MHTDTRSKNDEFETVQSAILSSKRFTLFLSKRISESEVAFYGIFPNFGWLLEDLNPLSIKLL